jgi:hypothetical protein
MSMKYKVSKCYETWNEEALEAGDTDDRGFIFQDQKMSLTELVNEIVNSGITDPSTWPLRKITDSIWLSSVDGNENYNTGEKTFYSLHIKASNRQMRRIFRLAGIK